MFITKVATNRVRVVTSKTNKSKTCTIVLQTALAVWELGCVYWGKKLFGRIQSLQEYLGICIVYLVQTAHVSSLPLTYGRHGNEPQPPCTRYNNAPLLLAWEPGTYSASLSTQIKSRTLE